MVSGTRQSEDPSDEDILGLLLAEEGLDALEEQSALGAPDRSRRAAATGPLSFAQRQMWFFEQWQPGTATYNVGSAYRVAGPLDANTLERAVAEVVGRHAVLRTGYATVDGETVQVIRNVAETPFLRRDLTGLDEERRSAAAVTLAEEEVRRPLALAQGQPLRVLLVRLGADEHLLVLTVHHIACDGLSLDLLLGDLCAAYEALEAGLPWRPDPAPQYADFAVSERERWADGGMDAHVDYWRDRLSGAPQVLELPTDRPRPPQQTFAGRTVSVPLPPSTAKAVRTGAAAHGTTEFTVLLSAFFALLARTTGQEDLVVGTSVATRDHDGLKDMVGLLVNTLPLRADLTGDPSFADLVRRVGATAAGGYAHPDVPLERLVDALGLERLLSHSPVFQVVFGLQRSPDGGCRLGRAELTGTAPERGTAKFDLTWNVAVGQDVTRMEIEYNTDLFDEPTVTAMAHRYLRLLDTVLADPGTRLGEVDLLDPAERAALTSARATERQPAARPVHEQVAEWARRTPDAAAVTDGQLSIPYGELDSRANRLAHRLRAAGIGPGDLVGVCEERGADLVVSLLAVLKAGAGYLPLDPHYPTERLRYLLQDSGTRLVLAGSGPGGRLPAGPWTLIDPADAVPGADAVPASAPDVPVSDDDVAYVIYTSGSTGRPKGVQVSHRNVTRLLTATAPWFGFGPSDVWTLFHSYAFDFSVWEIWGALAHGGRLVVVPYRTSRSPEEFHALLRREKVTVLNQTPSAFRALEAVDATAPSGLSLRLIVFGGEALDLASVSRWFSRHGSSEPRLVNMYGITETTVHVTYRPLGPTDVPGGPSPIGVPIPDLRLYLLDRWGSPVPTGVPGELYVGGGGVALGYLGRPSLTASRFLPDPFSGEPGARLYRTGDVARRTVQGELEYLGRNDDQVKVRGFRIETGEIEAALAGHPLVRAAVVVARADGGPAARLVGYIAADEPVSTGELREYLTAWLPDHMVPAAFVVLDELPMTAHGKVDRAALPAPDSARPELNQEYTAPRDEAERVLAEVWAEVLGLDRVGIHDSFFDLGGDSIRSLQVIGLAKQRGWEISLQDLFRTPVIAELAVLAKAVEPSGADRTVAPFSMIGAEDLAALPAGLEDAFPMSVLQTGMIYHMELDRENLPYHNLNSFHLRAPFDAELFRRAMQDAVDRHPILRTSFDLGTYQEPLQLVHPSAELPMTVEDLRGQSEQEQEQVLLDLFHSERQRPFDLAKPPFLRLFLHRRTDDTFQWSLTEHHAIFDGWSLFTFHAEVFQRYLELLADPDSRPAASPRSSFRDFIALERETAADPQERQYWLDKYADYTPVVLPRWPEDGNGPGAALSQDTSITGRTEDGVRHWRFTSTREATHRSLEALLPQEVVEGLLGLAARTGVPFKSVLLTAHLKVIGAVTGERDVVTGITANGRPEDVDSTEVCGMFLNMPPIRVDLAGGSWADLVRRVYRAEEELLPHRRYPLANIQWALDRPALFDNTFVYNHFHVMADVLGSGVSVLGNRVESTGDYRAEPTNYSLSTGFLRDPRSMRVLLRLDYYTAKLADAQAEAIRDYYLAVLAAMVHDDARHEDFSPLGAVERRRTLVEWNGPARDYPLDACVHELFEEQVRRTPHAVAVVDDAGELSYQQLNRRANQLARFLRAQGAGPESVVGVCLHRDTELVVALLAVLKSGAAYLPMDPQYPADRLEFVLRDAGAVMVLTDTALAGRVPRGPWQVHPLDGCAGRTAALPGDDLGRTSAPDNLMYVIYTSGSTGRPKGVQVPHSGVVNYLGWCKEGYASRGSGGAPVFSSIAFDMIVPNLYTPLVTGERLCMLHDSLDSVDMAARLTELAPFNFIKLTPGHLDLLGQLLGPEQARTLAATLAVGADAFPTRVVNSWRGLDPDSVVLNEYGPTEASVGNSVHFVDGPLSGELVPIGRPIPNTTMYVLDQALNPVPVGVTGELYIGGACVVRGYAGRPGLTADRFLPDPFAGEPGARMYRTGDLGRWLPGGALDFLGRVDDQVKINGYRVEPGEVEVVLAGHPAVTQAVAAVLGEDRAHRRLVGYYVTDGPVTEQELRDYLAERLPEYLLPSRLLRIDAVPLNANGKVDRKALPHPRAEAEQEGPGHQPPQTPLEELLAMTWEDLLGADRVSRDDSFVALGGNSLLATQLTFRLQQLLGIEVELAAVLRARDLADLARVLGRGITLQLGAEVAAVLLTPTQAQPARAGSTEARPAHAQPTEVQS
ncbi:amino acid adenylation domain-containing protein [Streptomyces sp. NPDC059629]|uniref:amino acid adenylation domain-containing protein n=1 Tax=Streptomyces sp. NPDC059629 TaxID=3346889 RepID=UPI00367D4629